LEKFRTENIFLKKEESNFSVFKKAWKHAWEFPSFRMQAIITAIMVGSFPFLFGRFFDFVEARQGKLLNDYLLNMIPSLNVSWIVFFFLYSGIVIGLYYHLIHPKTILIVFQTYIIVTLVRIVTITLIPLEPPVGYLPLREPFVQLFTTGGRIISKDLFFSGHMSTILSLYFGSHRKFVRTFLLFCSMMIGITILLQHVHYTIDVIVAVPATYAIYVFCKKFLGGRSY
jgi:hypothetical protein